MNVQATLSMKRYRVNLRPILACLAAGLAVAVPALRSKLLLRNRGSGIIENANDAIISADGTQTIVLANRSAAAMFLTTVVEMKGSQLTRFIRPDPVLLAGTGPLGSVAAWIETGRNGRRATDYAVTGVRANGESFPLEGSVSSSTESGESLYTIILRDVTERQQVQEKLSRSHAELRELSSALQTIREEERTHIAREIHDHLGQLLASLRMDLSLLQLQPGASPSALSLLNGMEENLLTAISSLRRIATNLRPRALDEGGLFFALQGLRDDFSERYAIPVALQADEAELRLDDYTSTAVFRIVQEALTNIARHADAGTVNVNLLRTDGQLLVEIRDDGRGIKPEDMEKPNSLGLIGMQERVRSLGGSISIMSVDPQGTCIEMLIPIR